MCEDEVMSDPGNIRNLVSEAVRLLAVGEDEIKQRLLRAYTQKLHFVFPNDVPAELSQSLGSIRERLFKEPTYEGQSTVEAALYRMHRKTASKIATDIFELHHALSCRGH